MDQQGQYAEAKALLKLLLISGFITLTSAAVIVLAWWFWS